jgi:hypothetical protein
VLAELDEWMAAQPDRLAVYAGGSGIDAAELGAVA